NTMYRSGTTDETTPTTDLRIPEERSAYRSDISQYLAPLTGAAIDADLPHYIAALRELDGDSDGPIFDTRYCIGAKFATSAACLDPSVAACGGFHGAAIATSDPDSPHLRVADASAAFVYGHADNDGSNPPEDVARLDAMLAEHRLKARTAV